MGRQDDSRIGPEVDHGPGNCGADGLGCLGEQLDGRLIDVVAGCYLCKVALGTGRRVRRYAGGEDLRGDREDVVSDRGLLTRL